MSDTGPKRILVIDGNRAVQEIVRSILVRKGYEVIAVPTCQTALDILGRGGVDLVICDVLVPDMDGITFVRHLKADPKLAALPVIFLTALDALEDELEGYLAGAGAYLYKPFKAHDLVAHVRKLLEQENTDTTTKQYWSRCLFLSENGNVAKELDELLRVGGVRLLHLPSSPKSLTELDHERYQLLIAEITPDGLQESDILRFLDSFELKLPFILLHNDNTPLSADAISRADAVLRNTWLASDLAEQSFNVLQAR